MGSCPGVKTNILLKSLYAQSSSFNGKLSRVLIWLPFNLFVECAVVVN